VWEVARLLINVRLANEQTSDGYVASIDDGETHGIRCAIGRLGFGPRGSHATAEHIGADHAVTIGIDRQPRAYHP